MKQFLMQWGAPVLALVLPAFASAAFTPAPISVASPFTGVSQLTGTTGLFCIIINWIFWLLIILTIIFILIAAYEYLTSGGDPEGAKKAGNRLIYAAIAVAVALLAKGLPYIVATFFGSTIAVQC